ncbi:hypothetical protein ABTG29_18750, partial [Acinetobacter baumannii]
QPVIGHPLDPPRWRGVARACPDPARCGPPYGIGARRAAHTHVFCARRFGSGDGPGPPLVQRKNQPCPAEAQHCFSLRAHLR